MGSPYYGNDVVEMWIAQNGLDYIMGSATGGPGGGGHGPPKNGMGGPIMYSAPNFLGK